MRRSRWQLLCAEVIATERVLRYATKLMFHARGRMQSVVGHIEQLALHSDDPIILAMKEETKARLKTVEQFHLKLMIEADKADLMARMLGGSR